MKVDLVGVGLNATDTLIPLVELPERWFQGRVPHATILPGGQVATTVVACQHWGVRTRYVGKLGDDDAANCIAENSRARAWNAACHGPWMRKPAITDPRGREGERTVLCRRDERLVLQPTDLKREWIVNARALHIDGHDTAAAALAARWAREAGVRVIADLDEAYPGVEDLLENIDYLIVSRNFPSLITGEPNSRMLFAKCLGITVPSSPPQLWEKKAYSHGTASSSSTPPLIACP